MKTHVSYVDTLCEKFTKMCNNLLNTIIEKKLAEFNKDRVQAVNRGKLLSIYIIYGQPPKNNSFFLIKSTGYHDKHHALSKLNLFVRG